MSVRKQPTGQWLCECYPAGRKGRRVRKMFATKGEALAFERFTMGQVNDRPWLGEAADRRTLSELAKLWYNLHGRSLAAGDKVYKKLDLIVDALGDPAAHSFNAKDFAHYRSKRLSGDIYYSDKWKKGAQPVTVNQEQSYLSAMFNELAKLGEWNLPNPLDNMRKYAIAEKEMAWLTHEQIATLLAACSLGRDDLPMVVKVCLSTGARWNEAEKLTRSQISPHKITFVRTKGKKNRSVPISKALHDELIKIKGDQLFSECYFRFMAAINSTDIKLPKGQLTHVLRHTFAAHFMMSGGNILVLQRILGHSDIQMTMRYAHLAPEHLETAVLFNPLATMNTGGKVAAQVDLP
ncbi:tyrosine-type recombinase/integrase [Yersinia ruckeri]|uniref:phage integrase n=1 Tax=Yersinia ruckeri TaxID=29486 RepID=UPI0020C0F8AE|nr:tyrosine-type recombinase/integrase [Yersinia ruckeri]MCK8564432.1 tyrosine-type recombinase/integrase [Yersinia ruckeri]UZY19461.1 tyrosine-type recombinase/integrase [Yersinia ruckeri]